MLREITGQAGNRVCRADEVGDALEEPLGQDCEPWRGEAYGGWLGAGSGKGGVRCVGRKEVKREASDERLGR